MKTKDKIYKFIVEYIKTHLYAPSIRDICDGVELGSTSSVARYLETLETDGLIIRDQFGGSRCIKLVGYKIVREDENESDGKEYHADVL